MGDQTQQSIDWEGLALTSHYDTAVAIRDALQEGNVAEATQGLEELINALSGSDERELRSYLIRLMQHIIKWRLQPERRTPSWVASIEHARHEIAELRQDHPRFTRHVMEERLWQRCLRSAHREAAIDLNRERIPEMTLSWDEVFDEVFTLEPEP
jgi:NAD-specific glutamate dehydrogenase